MLSNQCVCIHEAVLLRELLSIKQSNGYNFRTSRSIERVIGVSAHNISGKLCISILALGA